MSFISFHHRSEPRVVMERNEAHYIPLLAWRVRRYGNTYVCTRTYVQTRDVFERTVGKYERTLLAGAKRYANPDMYQPDATYDRSIATSFVLVRTYVHTRTYILVRTYSYVRTVLEYRYDWLIFP